MIVLLPPSEGKSSEPGTGEFRTLEPELWKNTQGVLKHLHAVDDAAIPKFLGVKQPHKAVAWRKKNLALAKAPCLPALERYSGVVYDYLDYPSLSAKKRAQTRLCVVSAMFGVIPGGTPIPEYKLPMNPWLTKYWKDINTARIESLAKKGLVVSLLSQTYAKAHGFEGALHVDFKVEGGKKSSGHFGKAIKGRFVRFLIESNVKKVDDFDGFTEEGYQFNGTDFVQQ